MSPVPAALLLALAGAAVGSFLGLLADRLPRGEPVLWGRSRCRACGVPLGPASLVPLISWLALRGRCAACAAPIPPDLPLIELAATLVGALGGWIAPGWWAPATALLGWALLLAAVLDWRHFWLPVGLTLGIAAAGLLAAALAHRLPGSLAGAALGFASLEAVRLLYRRLRGRDGLGGGDPLLFGGLGAWLGPAGLPLTLLLAAVGALGCTLALAALRRAPPDRTTQVPLGAWLAAAGFIVWCGGAP